jgi:tRNA(adenine34) deaminase
MAGISVLNPDDQSFMRLALREAERAFEADEVPVGAVVVHAGRVIGKGFNQREKLEDPTAHAEMLAITAAAQQLQSWRLEDCTLYVTLEPCPMCAGAIVNARVKRVVFGASDPKAGACGSLMNVVQDARLNHRVELVCGVLAEETGAILKQFFRTRRKAQSENASGDER